MLDSNDYTDDEIFYALKEAYDREFNSNLLIDLKLYPVKTVLTILALTVPTKPVEVEPEIQTVAFEESMGDFILKRIKLEMMAMEPNAALIDSYTKLYQTVGY